MIHNKDKYSDNIIRVLEDSWLRRYPRSSGVAHYNRTEFTGCKSKILIKKYSIDTKTYALNNPRYNNCVKDTRNHG